MKEYTKPTAEVIKFDVQIKTDDPVPGGSGGNTSHIGGDED